MFVFRCFIPCQERIPDQARRKLRRLRLSGLSYDDVCHLTNSSVFGILSPGQTQQQQEERPFSQVSGKTGNKQAGCGKTREPTQLQEVTAKKAIFKPVGVFSEWSQ